MRPFLACYRLRDGRRGALPLLAHDACDAAMRALDALGELRCGLSVRPFTVRGVAR